MMTLVVTAEWLPMAVLEAASSRGHTGSDM